MKLSAEPGSYSRSAVSDTRINSQAVQSNWNIAAASSAIAILALRAGVARGIPQGGHSDITRLE
jgi:hypothetical protein